MKKYFSKITQWVKGLFSKFKKKEEIQKEIPLEDAFRMWREQQRKKKRMALKYIVSLVFIVVYFTFGHELGFATSSPLWTHFSYSFQHAGLLHLIINTLVFIGAFRTMEEFISWQKVLVSIYVIAVIASFGAVRAIPTVGASGMIHAMFGMMAVIVTLNKSLPKQKAIFFCSIGIMMIVSLFNSNSNFTVHALSFGMGALYYLAHKQFNKI